VIHKFISTARSKDGLSIALKTTRLTSEFTCKLFSLSNAVSTMGEYGHLMIRKQVL
jgi:hypothetical protein